MKPSIAGPALCAALIVYAAFFLLLLPMAWLGLDGGNFALFVIVLLFSGGFAGLIVGCTLYIVREIRALKADLRPPDNSQPPSSPENT